MKVSIFNEGDRVLLVGEGNFSFSLALFHLNLKIDITATCYETNIDQDFGKKNIEYLKNYGQYFNKKLKFLFDHSFLIIKFIKNSMVFFSGIRVLLGVDATNLKEHPILKTELFDKIIFNFPHVGGKMRIEKNRELLKQFFISISESLKSNGQVLVTLCKGQGGTSIDNPPRRWDDSWKITEMAAHGNFILIAIEPFVWLSFQNYIVTGYRSLNKQFHSIGALTHIFIKSELPNLNNIAPKKKINILSCNNDNFSWTDINDIVNNITDINDIVTNINDINVDTHTYTFDITFIINEKFDSIKFYVLLYNYAGCIINNVVFIRSYVSSEKIEKRTYRISYRSNCLPLYRKRVINIHENLIADILENNLNVSVSR